jgi:hypothetical protein
MSFDLRDPHSRLTTREVATLFFVKDTLVWASVASGELPCVSPFEGSRIQLIREEDAARWYESLSTETRKENHLPQTPDCIARTRWFLDSVTWKKWLAQRISAEAHLLGVLVRRPCVVCGSEPAHGHHPNYDHPLEVVYLCLKHHMQEHARIRKMVGLPRHMTEEWVHRDRFWEYEEEAEVANG